LGSGWMAASSTWALAARNFSFIAFMTREGDRMRFLTIAALLAVLPWAAIAAPTWQVISSEPGKRIELDSTSIKREGNSVQAQGRIVLEKELIDIKSGGGYRIIEAITRYDCGTRNANTVKRIYQEKRKRSRSRRRTQGQ
jgi:hypothetical protein